MPDLSLLTLATLFVLVFVASLAWHSAAWLWAALAGAVRRKG